MTPEQLTACVGCSTANAQKWASHLTAAADCYDINTPKRLAAWLAQVAHESGAGAIVEENLNYTASRLQVIFPRHFVTEEIALLYAMKPEKIGSRVYGGRMGNGPEETQDGWRYRGRGLIQLTGKENYKACGEAIGVDLVGLPEVLTQPRTAAMSAGWFWSSRNLNALADKDDFVGITKKINGGTIGLEDRQRLWARCKTALGVV